MLDIGILDNVIAMVVVILVLSLIVQSIQAILKKAFKIKSRHLEDSLVDLFETALNKPGGEVTGWFVNIPFLRSLFSRKGPADLADTEVKNLLAAVKRRFKEIGRVAQSGKTILDSIDKDDLMKVLGKVAPGVLLPISQIKSLCEQIKELEAVINQIESDDLEGTAKTKFTAVHASLASLFDDVRRIFDGQDVKPGLVLENVINLKELKLGDVAGLLGEVQKKVEEDREAVKDSDAARAAALQALEEKLETAAATITALREKYDAALAPLRAKLNEVNEWYDTVMQSLEERYTRSMKTWAVVISFLVVAYLNANVIDIYNNISANEVLQSQLSQAGEAQMEVYNQRLADARQSQNAEDQEKILGEIKAEVDNLKQQVGYYTSLGFQPTKWQKVKERFNPSLWKSDGWWDRRKEDVKTLAGWLIMTFLLSIGAPFWQDALESLFGVKNLIRSKAGAKPAGDAG
ncbi:MAG: hypothetical protein L0229_30305 [Blastocatellia bacterium]|nr:hypothetical protein [Blastocatellia bacterium]